jgi:transposase
VWARKHRALHEALSTLVDEFALVGFETLDIGDKVCSSVPL